MASVDENWHTSGDSDIATRDTSGQHGLSDLNKRYFQLEFS